MRGVITCVTVVDEPPDGLVARLGARVTGYESNVNPGDATGADIVWTVAPGEDGSAQSTFVFIDFPQTFPGIADFHCGPGIPVGAPGVPFTLRGFSSVSAEIEVEVD